MQVLVLICILHGVFQDPLTLHILQVKLTESADEPAEDCEEKQTEMTAELGLRQRDGAFTVEGRWDEGSFCP